MRRRPFMPYVDPATVMSPRKLIRNVDVLYGDETTGWSAAWLDWDGDRVLGIRRNGGDNSGMGVPQSRGKPTWFVVPQELQQALLDRIEQLTLLEGYREMANDAEHEAEALEWSEALISDATHQER
jgi:hypothetical protein